jgi:hypothetical protein
MNLWIMIVVETKMDENNKYDRDLRRDSKKYRFMEKFTDTASKQRKQNIKK